MPDRGSAAPRLFFPLRLLLLLHLSIPVTHPNTPQSRRKDSKSEAGKVSSDAAVPRGRMFVFITIIYIHASSALVLRPPAISNTIGTNSVHQNTSRRVQDRGTTHTHSLSEPSQMPSPGSSPDAPPLPCTYTSLVLSHSRSDVSLCIRVRVFTPRRRRWYPTFLSRRTQLNRRERITPSAQLAPSALRRCSTWPHLRVAKLESVRYRGAEMAR